MVAVVGREAMHMMRRIKSIASGRSSVSDPVRVLFFFFVSAVWNVSCGNLQRLVYFFGKSDHDLIMVFVL